MAVSGSTDFSSTAVQLFTDARRALGINAEEEPIDATELAVALPFLTRMLKTWEADPDLGTWLISSKVLTLVQGQQSYLFGAAGDWTTIPFALLDDPPITINRGSSDVPMRRISRGDYQRLPNKTTQGCPTQWFYDRQRDNGTLSIWPAPDATASTLTIPYRRRIMDVDNSTDNIDLPPEWEEAVVFNFADTLIANYGLGGSDEADRVTKRALSTLAVLRANDVAGEESSLIIERDYPERGWR